MSTLSFEGKDFIIGEIQLYKIVKDEPTEIVELDSVLY
jgi:hypothetical protein